MERRFIVVVTGFVLLAGCSTQPDISLDNAKVQLTAATSLQEVALSEVNCLTMPVSKDKQKFSVKVPFNNKYLELPTGRTPFVAYRIPDGHYKITVDSYVLNAESKNEAEIFYPEIAFLNAEKEIIDTIGGDKVRYIKPGFIKPEGLTLSVDTGLANANCMLVYTTDNQRSGRTQLMNEAKEYAKVHGVVPSPFPDTYASHGDHGQLSISLKEQPAVIAPMTLSGSTSLLPVADSFSQSMQDYYLGGVRQALKNKQLDKAIELRTELKGVIMAVNECFSSQYGKPSDKIMLPEKPIQKESFSEQALFHYQSKMGEMLQSGQASSALKQLDNLQQLQDKVDRLFD